jgi:uncharacterized protein YneF (UPF0154 family)
MSSNSGEIVKNNGININWKKVSVTLSIFLVVLALVSFLFRSMFSYNRYYKNKLKRRNAMTEEEIERLFNKLGKITKNIRTEQ